MKSYDHWKSTNPADEWLGPEPEEEGEEEPETLCIDCSNFLNLEVGTPRQGCWYNHLCIASPLKAELDPVTGIKKPRYSDHWFDYCRNINKGHCAKFEPK